MSYDAIPQLGVPVHHRDLNEVLDMIDGFVQEGRATGRSHQIATINTDFLVNARRYEDVHAILRTSDLAIADGMPIVWASSWLGQRLPGRIAGADLVPALAPFAAERGYRIMFFGGAESVADKAAAVLRAEHPGVRIMTTSGDVSASGHTEPEVIEAIREFAPDILCVALGHPKQERWIRRHAGTLEVPVAIGVGGTFDFLAGQRARASPMLQRFGLEWLHRLAQEPSRLSRRYLAVLMVYVPCVSIQIIRTRLASLANPGDRRSGGEPTSRVDVLQVGDREVVAALRKRGALDQETVAELTSLACSLRRQGKELQLVTPDPVATRSLVRLRLDRLVRLVPAEDSSTQAPRFVPDRVSAPVTPKRSPISSGT